MMDFPTSPVVGTIISFPGGPSYRWSGVVWDTVNPGLNDPYPFATANMQLRSKALNLIAINDKVGGNGTDIMTLDNVGNFVTSGNVTAGQSIYSSGNVTATASVTASQNFQSSTNVAILSTNGAGTCYMRPNGSGSPTGQWTLGASGDMTVNDSGRVYGGKGLGCRAGYTGGYGGSVFNTFWSGSSLQVWVDGTNLGNMSVASDYRIKKDVVGLTDMWDTIKALRPIIYTQAEYGLFEADDIPRWGFIAHELQETMIMDAATGIKDDPDLIQSPNPWTVIAALTKALQEAMARIEALEAA